MYWIHQKTYPVEKVDSSLPLSVYRVDYSTRYFDWYDSMCIVSWLESSIRIQSAAWEITDMGYLVDGMPAMRISLSICKL